MKYTFFSSFGTPYLKMSPDTTEDNALLNLLEKMTPKIGCCGMDCDSGRLELSIGFEPFPPTIPAEGRREAVVSPIEEFSNLDAE